MGLFSCFRSAKADAAKESKRPIPKPSPEPVPTSKGQAREGKKDPAESNGHSQTSSADMNSRPTLTNTDVPSVHDEHSKQALSTLGPAPESSAANAEPTADPSDVVIGPTAPALGQDGNDDKGNKQDEHKQVTDPVKISGTAVNATSQPPPPETSSAAPPEGKTTDSTAAVVKTVQSPTPAATKSAEKPPWNSLTKSASTAEKTPSKLTTPTSPLQSKSIPRNSTASPTASSKPLSPTTSAPIVSPPRYAAPTTSAASKMHGPVQKAGSANGDEEASNAEKPKRPRQLKPSWSTNTRVVETEPDFTAKAEEPPSADLHPKKLPRANTSTSARSANLATFLPLEPPGVKRQPKKKPTYKKTHSGKRAV